MDFDSIESYLNQFGGGEVNISKVFFQRGLAIIYLNHAGKRNAMSGKMMVELRACVLELEQWKEGKAVLICGKHGNFCSGGDLDFAKASGTQKEAMYMSSWMQDTLKRLQGLPLISFSLIQGPTIGGGAEISIYCDFVIASEDVKFGFVHGKMGIITAWGGSTRLVQKLGYKKALDLLLTSEILSAQNCLEIGIADHVVPADNFFAAALEFIDLKLVHHPSIIKTFKQVCNNANRATFDESLNYERGAFSLTWGSDLNRDALAKKIKHVKHSKM